jgi:hypothetical protein
LSATSQIRLGIQGGINAASPTVSGLGASVKDKKNTVAPGIVFEFSVLPGFNLRPSLNYLTTNVTTSQLNVTPGVNANTQTVSNNLQIPLDLTFPIKAGKKGKILLMAGPVVTMGLSGDVRTTNLNAGTGTQISTSSSPIQFGNGSAQVKGIDWGSRFGLGYRWGKLDLAAQYKFGFTDANNSAAVTSKQHILSLTAAYFLIGK